MKKKKYTITHDQSLRAVVDNIDTGVVIVDTNYRITFWNKWLSTHMRVNEENALNRKLTDVFAGITAAVISAIDSVIKTGQPRVLSPALHPIWVPRTDMIRQYVKITPLDKDSEDISGVIITIQDMTARFEYERNLKEQAQREWEQIFQAIGHPAMVLDKDYRIVAANRAVTNALNASQEEIMGRLCYNVFHATEEPPDNCPLKKLKATGSVETEVMELHIFSGIFFVSCTPVFDDEGKLDRVIHVATDITSLRQTEELLRKSQERYRAFIKESFDAICMMEIKNESIDISLPVEKQIEILYDNTEIAECNQVFAQTHGYRDVSELTGMRIGTMFPRLAKEHVQYIGKFIENGYHITGIETKEIASDGSIHHFLNSMVGYIENKNLVRIWSTKHDITNLRLAMEQISRLNEELEERVRKRTKQLEEANSELEAFTYSIAHDLRSPLRAIEGFSTIVVQDYAPLLDDEGQRLLNVVRSNAQKMDRLITAMLSLSRVSRADMEYSRINMTAIASSLFEEITSNEPKEEIVFSLSPLPDAFGDPALIRQIWSNLLSNAVKYTKKKGKRTIEINGYTDKGMNIYVVKDNGVGFNPEYSHKLFSVFQRLHKDYEGTGVGLAIVQRIASRHGGAVWAESREGEGATFRFSLPAEKSGVVVEEAMKN